MKLTHYIKISTKYRFATTATSLLTETEYESILFLLQDFSC